MANASRQDTSNTDDLRGRMLVVATLEVPTAKDHLRQYAYEVTDVLANSAPTPFGYEHDHDCEDDEENAPTLNPPSRPSTPPPKKRPPGGFVLFSPSKKNKLGSRTNGPTGGSDEDDDEDDEDYYGGIDPSD